MKLATLLILGLSLSAWCEIIPSTRRMTWTPNVTVGVPGGITNRTTIFVNVKTTENPSYLCAGDGVTDDSTPLTAALNACPVGQVVYVPAGTYLITAGVNIGNKHNITLRGAGIGQTWFKLLTNGVSTSGRLHYGAEEYHDGGAATRNAVNLANTVTVSAGATNGSVMMVTTNTSNVNVSNYITLWADTPSWIHSLSGPVSQYCYDSNAIFTFQFLVTNKTDTTVSFTPPIPFEVSAMNPKIIPWGISGRVTFGIGFEDFSVDATNGNSAPVYAEQGWGCWFKNMEIGGAHHRQILMLAVSASEVRQCYTHDAQGNGPNHEGVDFMNDCCWNLVENNRFVFGGTPPLIFGDGWGGCVGNVAAYNFFTNNPDYPYFAEISDSHGSGGNALNLYEGNIGSGFTSDGYFGGSSHGTLLRNWFHNQGTADGRYAIKLNHYAVYYNLVGNVLGWTSGTQTYEYSDSGTPALPVIYALGFPNAGNWEYGGGTEGTTIGPTTPPDYTESPDVRANAQALDLNVSSTIIRHGNYDYANAAIVWDEGIADHSIPNSLLYASKPTYFGTCPWPPFDPASPASANPTNIPAGYRYAYGSDPSTEPTPPGPVTLRANTVTVRGTVSTRQ